VCELPKKGAWALIRLRVEPVVDREKRSAASSTLLLVPGY
jgi:hypothetical protein